MYEYRAKLIRAIDGDTIQTSVDLGFGIWVTMVLRLDGIDTPEVVGMERPEGLRAKAFVESLLPPDSHFVIQTKKDRKDKYGRYLAKVLYMTDEGEMRVLNDELLEAGLAVPMRG